MEKIQIFLASSSELKTDRIAFKDFIHDQNDKLIEQGFYINLKNWENFIDALSPTRLQDEYNESVKSSDIFVMLFSTKVGQYTEEEFETALKQFQKTQKPRIYTYYKNVANTGSNDRSGTKSLWAFQDKLESLGHFPTNYENSDFLCRHFGEQLGKLNIFRPTQSDSGISPAVKPPEDKQHSLNLQEETVVLDSELLPRQKKLKARLVEQLNHPELAEVIRKFIQYLKIDHPQLNEDAEKIADFLVSGGIDKALKKDQFLAPEDESDIRLATIQSFLNASNESSQLDELYEMFGYLLQTLVKETENTPDELIKVSVKRKQTLELLNATENTNPLVPDYGEQNLEFSNGMRNSHLENIGDFLPPTGEFTVEGVCQEMAMILLKSLGDPDQNPENPVGTLTGRLVRHKKGDPRARLQGIYVNNEVFAEHPLYNSEVVEYFTKMTKNRLPIYIYGVPDAEECLHINEEYMRGLVVEDNPIVENYNNKNHLNNLNENKHNSMATDIKIGNVAEGATVILQSTVDDTQIGQGNIKYDRDSIAQLHQYLQQVLMDADAEDVNKRQYAEISQAVKVIETETQKAQGADKSILSKAKAILEPLKNISSIAGSIAKILPFITF